MYSGKSIVISLLHLLPNWGLDQE